jgi:hypothetical protein
MKPVEELAKLVKKLFIKQKFLLFDGPQITVEFEDGKHIGLERLSSGEKHLIRILVAGLRRMKTRC